MEIGQVDGPVSYVCKMLNELFIYSRKTTFSKTFHSTN